MEVIRIGKNRYKIVEGYIESFDSYTNILFYKEELEKQLSRINEMLIHIELIGETVDDLGEAENDINMDENV